MTLEEKIKIIKRECSNINYTIESDNKVIYIKFRDDFKDSQKLHDLYLIMLEVEKFFPKAHLNYKDPIFIINLNIYE